MAAQPQYDLESEQAVIGACLDSLDAIFDASEEVAPQDFHDPINGHLFAAMLDMAGDGRTDIDPVTVAAYLRGKGIGADVVSMDHMATCRAMCEHPGNVGSYAKVVADLAQLARLHRAAHDIREMALRGGDPAKIVAVAEERLFSVASSRAGRKTKARTIGEAFPDWMATLAERKRRRDEGVTTVGVSTGLADLDKSIDGLVPGRLYVVGAPPGAGKSSLVLRFAESMACDAGMAVLGQSIEMTETEVMDRFMSGRANVPADAIKHGDLSDMDEDRIAKVGEQIHQWPLKIDTTKQITVMEIRQEARRMAAKYGDQFGMIWLDYFQLLEAAQTQASSRGNLSDVLSEMSRQLKIMAGEFNVAVVVLSQLVKAGTDFNDTGPRASMLKGTGALHNDADVVMLIHRPDLNSDDLDVRSGVAYIKVEKNRHGKFPDSIPVAYLGRYTTFRDLAMESAGSGLDF